MSEIAEALRRKTRDEVLALSPAERIELALRLGERDLDLYAAAHGVSRQEARRRLRAQRAHGRRPSRCAGP